MADEPVQYTVQYNLTWTMTSSRSGAEFFSPGAMAEALLRVTSENSAGLHLGSKQSITVLSQLDWFHLFVWSREFWKCAYFYILVI